jgi:MFS family permease
VLASLGTFAVGFVARPIGAVLFGHWGDRLGRKSMLVASLLVMGLSTVAVGLVPGYATIGVWAPALLTTLRFLQGVGSAANVAGRC